MVERGATARDGDPARRALGRLVDRRGARRRRATITVDAPLDKLPLFLREGGIVPMLRPTIDSLAPTTEPDAVDSYATHAGRLHVRVGPGPAQRLELYDGAALRRHPSGPTVLHLEIAPGSVFTAGVQFEVLALAAITEVFDNDTPLTPRTDAAALDGREDGWTYENATGGTLRVKLGPGAHTLVATLAP